MADAVDAWNKNHCRPSVLGHDLTVMTGTGGQLNGFEAQLISNCLITLEQLAIQLGHVVFRPAIGRTGNPRVARGLNGLLKESFKLIQNGFITIPAVNRKRDQAGDNVGRIGRNVHFPNRKS